MSLIERVTRATVCLHLAPHGLDGVLRRAGRPVADSAFHVPILNPDASWEVALASLRGWLEQHNEKKLPLAVSLASRWCAMLMVPWSGALLDRASAQRFLHSQFAAVYGDGARAWRLAADDAPYGKPRLACGIDAALLQGVQDAAAAHGRRCLSIEPVVGPAWRSIAGSKPAAFALVEGGRLLLATSSGGRIAALHSQSCAAAWGDELDRAWRRWNLRAPQLDAIEHVALLDLSGEPQDALPARFQPVAVASAAHLMREAAWA
ncbi:hypothetical protein [Janthinobacterium violaceinigrum]|uniref:Uncharacterized protein n=1 Tax=Janthinobacterium violaceinigrum TaxID=2654252 RepID=A0A6I1IBB2_9BURK|nr:hypothetical protein [Janthinobacterium violaceinigrum]KAB8064508.1 hypothetical protein GCN75_12585 [Janthinobacterium violaceinigrum]